MKNKLVFEKIKEGSTEVFVFRPKKTSKGPGTKEGIPFYNPSMELNRDLSIVFGQYLANSKKNPSILDGLAASGIRGVRLANEIEGDIKIAINDWNADCFDLIQKNIKNLNLENVDAYNNNLNKLLSDKKFDYIDIDPFGSPANFVESAIKNVKNNGVISCTATDTATLSGVYPKACFRRYGAVPFHSIVMKEVGIRILLGFIAEVAGEYDKEIEPLLSYVTDHYFRVYVKVKKDTSNGTNLEVIKKGNLVGLEKADKDIGPLWIGKLQDKKTIGELRTTLFKKKLGTKNQLWKLLDSLEEEADAPCFFYTSESIASKLKSSVPKSKEIFSKIKKDGFEVYKTHFSQTGFKTNAPITVIEKVFKP